VHFLFNALLGLLPAFALGAAIASDEKKSAAERVVSSDADRTKQTTMFLLVFGLWSLTLAMWNWMRSYPRYWIAVWAVAGVVTLAMTWRRSRLKVIGDQ
jgi:hypothetical protein